MLCIFHSIHVWRYVIYQGFDALFRSMCLAGSTASLLEQILGCNTFDATPEVHSVSKAFKGMQCAVASTCQSDLSSSKQLNVHEVDVLSGGPCRQSPTSMHCTRVLACITYKFIFAMNGRTGLRNMLLDHVQHLHFAG